MKNKKRLQRVSVVLVSLLALAMVQFIGSACDDSALGTLTYWEANATQDSTSQIFRWGKNSSSIPRYMYSAKLNGKKAFYFSGSFNIAVDAWGRAFGITMENYLDSTPEKSSKIIYYGGTKAEIDALNIFSPVPSDWNGNTQPIGKVEGNWTYGSTTKTGYLLSQARGYVVDANRSAEDYKATATHELGHAMGWGGHTTNRSAVMYTWNTLYTLTSIDKRQVTQVYA
jgi:hypothetical protein